MAKVPTLTKAEKKLVDCAANGTFADFRAKNKKTRRVKANDPRNDPATGGRWGKTRTIRASVLRRLLVDRPNDWPVHARGVRVWGAKITGSLDLEATKVDRPLFLLGCRLMSPITLLDTRTRGLFFQNCRIAGLKADRLNTKGNLNLGGTSFDKGEVRLAGAKIDGQLNCSSANFKNPRGYALNAQGISVKGSVFLHNKFSAKGGVSLSSAKISGQLTCSKGTFNNAKDYALNAQGISVKGDIFLDYGFTAKGGVSLSGAEIGGQLACREGTFDNAKGYALNAQGISVKSNVYLDNGFSAKGEVSLSGAEISGQLTCDEGAFDNAKGYALNAQGISVKSDVFLRNKFSAKGEVSLAGAEIGGQLACDKGAFDNAKGYALNAQGISVKSDVFLRNKFSAKGGVSLAGAEIGGQLVCSEGTFDNAKGYALNAQGISVKRDVFLDDGFTAKGEVSLSGAEIGGQLSCMEGTFNNTKGTAFILQDAKVMGPLFWQPAVRPIGVVDFQHAQVGPLADAETGWPEPNKLFLDGFEYLAIAPGAPQAAKERLDWLRRQPMTPDQFVPQPYEHLIKVFRQMGHTRDARDVGFAKHEDFRLNGCCISRREWLWNWTLGVTIGHGYKPWITLYWMLAVVLAGWLVFTNAETLKAIHPSKEIVLLDPRYINSGGQWLPPDYPKFSTIMYSVDVFLPIVDFHQESYWLPGKQEQALFWGWGYKVWLWLEILLGWFLTTIAVAGLTGIVKKD